ncbi:cytochrome c [Azorhizobium oxalatiphilum]|uniref:Cytochrome c n=1 Tax=Azorhizobium oxalatiphilum TaxID=980631 RepID=A0A917C9L7_9HYPH|nr:c-type cytochrome [Azorhizobium oxalatiphilum]GGF74340.1 cytochrome c [Azorhizobium oxalatiphilum]
MTRSRAFLVLFLLAMLAAIGALVHAARPDAGPDHWEKAAVPPGATLAQLLPHADPKAGEQLFKRCAACHSIRENGPNLNGPNLYGVMGSQVGRNSARFAYTAALQAVSARWDAARMDAWLKGPRALVPGTSMVFPGVPSPTERADLIAYLLTQGGH